MKKKVLNLSAYKSYDSNISSKIQFYDDKNEKIIGHIIYNIWEKEDTGHIASAFLDEEYRGIGIINQILPKVFCDMKCKLPTIKKIHLHASSPKIWTRFGFHETGETGEGNMIKEFPDIVCECRCEIDKLIEDDIKPHEPIQSEKKIRDILKTD